MTTITLNQVTKRFAQGAGRVVIAVDDLSLKIASGDVLAILGPSGCGKSTLLRIVAGLIAPDSGQVFYDDIDLKDVPLMQRGVGMVFQEGALMPHWETRRTVGFFLALRKRESEIPERVKRISRITGIGLEQLLERRPGQLSGGEKQRVAIARALARDLRVLLFDEPFANLDAKIRTEARVELNRLLHEFPVTSIYVTHDQIEAIALSHRIAVMREGRLEQVGTFPQLYSSPVNLFVAGFIGTPAMNLFSGRIREGRWWGEVFGGYPVRGDLADGAWVTMGIRAEHVRLEPNGTPAVVERATPHFAERYQLVEVWLAQEHWQFKLPLDQRADVGSTLYCALDPDAMLYFDTKTGKRVG